MMAAPEGGHTPITVAADLERGQGCIGFQVSRGDERHVGQGAGVSQRVSKQIEN